MTHTDAGALLKLADATVKLNELLDKYWMGDNSKSNIIAMCAAQLECKQALDAARQAASQGNGRGEEAAVVAALNSMRPQNDESDWTATAYERNSFITSAIETVRAALSRVPTGGEAGPCPTCGFHVKPAKTREPFKIEDVSQDAMDWATAEIEKVQQFKAENPDWENNTRPARDVIVPTGGEAELHRATVERCATTVLEQRCERGTPWDLACTTIARAIFGLIGEAHRSPVDAVALHAETATRSAVQSAPVVKSFVGSMQDDRCLEVWFADKVTEQTRAWLLAAINEKALGAAQAPMVPKHLLDGRDDFIVSKGLWSEFTSSLPSADREGK